MSDDNIVNLADFKDKYPVRLKETDYHKCQHPYFDVWRGGGRRVTCRVCGEELDPYWVLEKIAIEYRMADYRIRELQRLEKRLERSRAMRKVKKGDSKP